jgi:hypothetical protein
MPDIPTTEPASLRAGDTWKWTRTLDDYPAGTWTLKYRFKFASGGFEITATASGTDHAVDVAAATTAAYVAASYQWIAWVESGAEKYTVGSGSMEVLPDYRSGLATVALDDRSHAQKLLDKIESWLESRDPAVAEYEIAGRRMKYIPISDLIKLRSKYQAEIATQANSAALAKGEGVGRKIQFRI